MTEAPQPLNADFSQRVVMRAEDAQWVESPSPGVTRRMLERIGGEVARATSVVRYAAKARFPEHTHGGGEEFLVLEGVFRDAQGEYGPGCYVRNPPGSAHAPWSERGCTLFVKLHQMHADDRATLRIDTTIHPWIEASESVLHMPLFSGVNEVTALVRLAPGAACDFVDLGGFESLVLDGEIQDQEAVYQAWDWVRLPAGQPLRARAGPAGCSLFVKQGPFRVPEL